MTTNTAKADWQGDLPTGKGEVSLGNGAFTGQYSFKSRFEDGEGTNPEELIAAAHAACFSMAFSNELASAGFKPSSVQTQATVTLGKAEGSFGITQIDLATQAVVPNIDNDKFQELGEKAKKFCPISKALAGVGTINLKAELRNA